MFDGPVFDGPVFDGPVPGGPVPGGQPLPPPPPLPPTAAAEATEVALRARAPRAGELTTSWRWATAVLWLMVVAAQSAVWKTSDQLGLSTWWLGPRGEPHPRIVQLLPFVPAVAMVLATINNVRWLAWLGVAAGLVVAAIGIGDLDRVTLLGIAEIGIGCAAALVSVASLSGTFRRAGDPALQSSAHQPTR